MNNNRSAMDSLITYLIGKPADVMIEKDGVCVEAAGFLTVEVQFTDLHARITSDEWCGKQLSIPRNVDRIGYDITLDALVLEYGFNDEVQIRCPGLREWYMSRS